MLTMELVIIVAGLVILLYGEKLAVEFSLSS